MATTKITVTIPEDLAVHIRRQVEVGAFESVSAYITKAGETLRDFEPLDLLIATMVAESGEPDAQAVRWVDEAMAAARRAQLTDLGETGHAA